jgi:hypothetical protein
MRHLAPTYLAQTSVFIVMTALSAILLAESNYTMQCLSAPHGRY